MRDGLDSAEATSRLRLLGPNEIPGAKGTPAWRKLISQFTSPLVLLLLAACAVSIALGEAADAIAIGAIVALNGFIGFYQEYRAERAVAALRAMTAPRARVRRSGRAEVIPAAEVVVGDLLLLEAGDVVAADARLLEAHALGANEAALTGESLPSEKDPAPTPPDALLGDRTDRVFLGSAITAGTGVAEVIATGPSTELGKIARMLEEGGDTATPLQRQLARVGHVLLGLCLCIVALVAATGLARGEPWFDVLLLGVSLAVAAVPEGLPAVVTIALAIGVRRMAARHVLVRQLPAVETLGSATVICTDKTGTLTSGCMAVRETWGPDRAALLHAAAACTEAQLDADGSATGSPTEVALLRAARELGIERRTIELENPRVDVHPFDPVRKRMSVERADGKLYVKGAADLLLPLCSAGGEGALAANDALASSGLRVLAVAVGDEPEEAGLRLLGLVGLADPPRPEVIEAIAQARRAGVTTVMVTGDHAITAEAIAREIGLLLPGEDPATRIHARVTPERKLAIVREWKRRGAVVAMTGDGVNDAPALKEAHIGIAMGLGGTEVTREAADMVLADDNFASIVAAIREGRGIWDNIQKTVVYLLSGNFGELVTVLGATLLGFPLPLLPLHLLWINLVTDGLPALALVMDPASPDVLERPPRAPGRGMLGRGEWLKIAAIGLLESSLVLGVFAFTLEQEGVEHARSLAFSTLVFAELFRAFGARDPERLFFELGANWRLVGVVACSALGQLLLHALPVTRDWFRLTALDWSEVALASGLGLVPVTLLEGSKLLRRGARRLRTRAPAARG